MERQNRVLIVDSDEQVLISLEHLLEDQGIATETAWSAHDALELMRSLGFDVLLIGDDLADPTSEQLLREIQQEGVGASILVMESCGSRVKSSAKHFAELGASATVPKRDYGQLLARINTIAAARNVTERRCA